MSRVGLFQGGCLLLGVCEGEGRPPVVMSVGEMRAIHKVRYKMRKKKLQSHMYFFLILWVAIYSSAVIFHTA